MESGYWHSCFTLKNSKYPRFVGAPLDGITDSPFRQLVRQWSPHALLYTEMRHVGSLVHGRGLSAAQAFKFEQSERPLLFQISANGTEFIEQAVEKIIQVGVDGIDLNIGCPARAVVSSGSGSALMAEPEKLKAIVSVLRKSIPGVFTVKMRAGFKEQNGVYIAQMLEDLGVDGLAVHPRLQTQMFAGRPDYAYAAQIKSAVNIPVLLSGNIVNWVTARMAYEQTGVDGFLIGRGMWAQPWKLFELTELSQEGTFSLDRSTVLKTAQEHYRLVRNYYGTQGVFCFRKHLPFYIRGVVGASAWRQKLVQAQDPEVVEQLLIQAFEAA